MFYRRFFLTAKIAAGVMVVIGLLLGGAQASPLQPSPGQATVPASSQEAITETHWNLIELDGSPVKIDSARKPPYIYLQVPGDRLSGSGGCNRLLGSFDLSGNSLQFHSVASTMMACPGNSMAQESALLQALKLTTSFQIAGDVLQLRVDDRVLARFEAEKRK